MHACALLLCDIQRGCARALLSMWVHACFSSVICNEHWVLISFGDICLSTYPCSCGYTLTFPPPHTLPYYPRTKHQSCPLSQFLFPEKKTCFDVGKIGFCHCAAVLQTQVLKLCTDLDLCLLYILILGTYSKFARKNHFIALGVCFPLWPQVCHD